MSEAVASEPFALRLSRSVVPARGAAELTSPRPEPVAGRRNLLVRLLDLVIESRERQAEREIARLVERRGGKFTDEVERRIEERLLEGRGI